MNELESLASKSDADLAQIAVAFGDFTEEEAKDKTREELIQAIPGKAAPAEEAKPAPKKRGRKKKTEEAPKAEEQPAEAKALEPAAEEAKPAPKKRGRKKKTED